MKPVASKTEFHRAVNKWAKWMGLTHPWTLQIQYGGRDPDDEGTYAGCSAQPNYFRAGVFFDPTHDGWQSKEEGLIHPAVRHELFHAFVSEFSEFAKRLCGGDKDLENILDDYEERLVTRLTAMPIWDLEE
jgi:hypothetical protein